MNRRRTRQKPPAALDWRALAAPPDQRRFALPVTAGGDIADDLELAVRTGSDGRKRVTLVASVTLVDAAVVDALAEQLHAAAVELRKHDAVSEPIVPPVGEAVAERGE